MSEPIRLGTAAGRGVLATTILGSGMVFLDSTIANVATRKIGEEFNASFGALQWVQNGYLLPLASLILLGGSLGDRLGRRRVFLIGVAWFAGASLLCAVAPNIEILIAARALQGVGGALLTPGSLAIVSASFAPDDRAAAVGAWSGLGGIASPIVFGHLIATGGRAEVFGGYALGGCLMLAAAAVARVLAVDAERCSLEAVAAPLSLRESSPCYGASQLSDEPPR